MASTATVGPFDPGHDRAPQLLQGRPGPPVEDVVLQQAEERLHGGVVASGSESAELCEARKRIKLLEQENEVLRRAAAYLSQAHLPGKGSTRS